MDYKDAAIAICLALLGGAVRYAYAQIEGNSDPKYKGPLVAYHLLISGFSGALSLLLGVNYKFSQELILLSCAIAGLSGHVIIHNLINLASDVLEALGKRLLDKVRGPNDSR